MLPMPTRRALLPLPVLAGFIGVVVVVVTVVQTTG
jgi:hypothetical protein